MKETRDIFLCHASADKQAYVEPLIQELERWGISYWLSEEEILWGDSIYRYISDGLNISRYVIVFLSESFIGRRWPESELENALAAEDASGEVRVLVILIGNPDVIFERFPLLRRKLYTKWGDGVELIVNELRRRLEHRRGEHRIPVSERQEAIPSGSFPADVEVLLREVDGLKYLLSLRGEREDLAFVAQILDGFCRVLLKKYGVASSEWDKPRVYPAFLGLLRALPSLGTDTPFTRDFPNDIQSCGYSIDRLQNFVEEINVAVEQDEVSRLTIYLVQDRLLKLYVLCRDLVAGQIGSAAAEARMELSWGTEDEHTEFKSTLRFNLATGKPDKQLEMGVIKAIAGLTNYEGGTLFIGVDDEGEPVGVEPDLSTLRRGNEDSFRRHFSQIVIARLGAENYHLVDPRFVPVRGKKVCVVKVRASSDGPVYVKDGAIDRLFVRMGAHTKELNAREAIAYYKRRWPNEP